MLKRTMIVVALLSLGSGITAVALSPASETRPDCPGKIVCPLTGELICRDQCPLIDANRADCPGRIVCPLTGELICRDECPLIRSQEDGEDDFTSALPPCCAGSCGAEEEVVDGTHDGD